MNKAEYASSDTLVSKLISMGLGVVKGYIISLVLLFILACIVTYTSFPESYVNGIISVITVIGILFASISVAKKYRTLGWLHGAITGVLYSMILYVLSASFLSFTGVQKGVLSFLVIGVVCGALGGIVGVNLKKR